MKRIRTFGLLLLFVFLLLTGCSINEMAERGTSVLDNMFAGARIPSTPSEPEPEPSPEPAPEGPQAEEPEISDLQKPVVPDYSSSQPAVEPPEPVNPTQSQGTQPAAQPSSDVTPSHTDVTFFGVGESFRYLPKGISGVYACSYTTEDSTVASVNTDTGKVTAVGPGMTKVKMHVEYNGQYDFECVVRCNWEDDGKKDSEKKNDGKPESTSSKKNQDDEPVLPPSTQPVSKPETSSSNGITASHSDATFFNPKEHFRLLPVGAGDDYTSSYSTSNAEVATVDEKTGTVTAVGPGTATVTMLVDCGGSEYTFECIVRCNW